MPSYKTTRITKQGRVVDVWIVVSGLRNDSGEIDSLATTERDITSFKDELRKKDEEVKILKGLLPMCAHCKKIRDVSGAWLDIETYITVHSEAAFSYGICSKCAKKYFTQTFFQVTNIHSSTDRYHNLTFAARHHLTF